MVLLPATIIPRRLVTNAWNSWCIVMLIVIATEARAQNLETLTGTNGLPPQVLQGMDMSHEAYRFCDEPEDVLTQSIPHGCSVKALECEPQDTESAPKQE